MVRLQLKRWTVKLTAFLVSIVPAYGMTAIVVAEIYYDMKMGFW